MVDILQNDNLEQKQDSDIKIVFHKAVINGHDFFQMSGSTCMDISILGASLVWFLTGISMEQVKLDTG